jgi:hypothetical protein
LGIVSEHFDITYRTADHKLRTHQDIMERMGVKRSSTTAVSKFQESFQFGCAESI